MARVDVSMSSDLEPEAAWKLASDLRRFDEWMTIFGGWRGTVPSTIEEGTRVSSCIKVKGFRNIIHWKVTHYDEPNSVELQGRGRGGIRIAVAMTITNRPARVDFSSHRRSQGRRAQRAGRRAGRQSPAVRRAQVGEQPRRPAVTGRPGRLPYGWPNQSRSAWRMRLRSMASHASPAPNASNATIAAATPAPARPGAKLVTQATNANTAAATTRSPGVRGASCTTSS